MNSNRQSSLTIDLGKEEVDLERVEMIERLSTPFVGYVDVISETEMDLYPHLGKPCAVTVKEDGDLKRHVHGIVAEGEYLDQSPSGHHYRLTIRPATYFLEQNRNMAIWAQKSAQDIITQVLDQAGIDYSFSLTRSRDNRIYTVQYRESDWAFINRLMEEEGMYFFFEHGEDRHTMIIVDDAAGHPVADVCTLHYLPHAGSVKALDASSGRHFLESWAEHVSTQGQRRVTLRDYDFMTASAQKRAMEETDGAHPDDSVEVFDYPGNQVREVHVAGGSSELTNFTKNRPDTMLKGLRARRQIYVGKAQSSTLRSGAKTRVIDHPHARFNSDYLIVAAHNTFVSETYRSSLGGQSEAYSVRFEAIPYKTPFQPPRRTPQPVVQGLESAVVVGPAGETIHTDKFGRVQVQFHWDRQGSMDGKSDGQTTAWLRVSQTGGLGNIILPRVGHEVLIDFLNGDPDRPVVVGRVFNSENMPTYKLPDHKTRAVWRTKRYGDEKGYDNAIDLDTGAPGANELRFEDASGKEEVFLHAERFMNTRVRQDETHHVGQNQAILIGYNREEEVKKDETIKIGENRKEDVGKDEEIKIGSNRKEEVGNNEEIKIGSNQKINIGQSHKSKVGTEYTLEAGTKITLKCGTSKIVMDPASITISSTQINVKANAMAEVKSPMTTVKGDGMLTLKGGITLIN